MLKIIERYYKDYKISEVHIVGGLNPELDFEYYEELIRKIRNKFPKICIKAFSAVEIDFLSRKFRMNYEEVLSRLKEAGLDMIPGGGAEIFDDEIRERICPKKISGEDWLRIHEIAHKLGIKTNATMLYGHLENDYHRIKHLIKLNELNLKTNGFVTFIPLKFKPKGTEINVRETNMYDDLFTIAISRIILFSFKNITAYWPTIGIEVAKLSMNYGANDFGGTIFEEDIIKSKERNYITREEFISIIKSIGFIPVERDSFFNEINIYK